MITFGDPSVAAKHAVKNGWFKSSDDTRLMGYGKSAGYARVIHDIKSLIKTPEKYPDTRLVGVYRDGSPCGFIWVEYLGEQTKTVVLHCYVPKEYRGKWVFHVGIKKLLKTLFKTGIYRVECHPLRINKRLISALRKYGFKQEGVKRSSLWMDGEVHDQVLMRVLRKDWRNG